MHPQTHSFNLFDLTVHSVNCLFVKLVWSHRESSGRGIVGCFAWERVLRFPGEMRKVLRSSCHHPFCFFLLICIFVSVGCEHQQGSLPNEIRGLRLAGKITGKQAADEFLERLHLRQVTTRESEIGFYSGETSATIYITFYKTTLKAREDWLKMTRKISAIKSAFSGGKYSDFRGREIYRCRGLGQVHIVFADRSQLFWISADSSIAKDLLMAYLSLLD